jgi:hypothetical protein
MTIGSLPQKDTIEYLKTKFADSNISIDENTAKYLISTASDIPHYIQLLASEIWQDTVNDQSIITKEMIDKCTQKVLENKSDYYMELFDRQSQSRKQLLQALTVEGKSIFSGEYIKKYRLPAASTLQRSVKEMINNGIIEKVANEYFIADPFFKMFVAQY